MQKKLSLVITFFLFSTIITQAENLSAKQWVQNGVAAYCQQTNADVALNCYTQALAVSAEYVPALIALGDFYAARGDDESAREFFLRAIQDNRDSEYALHALSSFYETRADLLREEKYLQNILPKISNNFIRLMINNYLGELKFSLGKTDEAKKLFYKNSIITNWMIVGGFDNNERTGLNKSFGPEENIALDQTYEGKEWQVKWRPVFPFRREGSIDLNIVRPKKWIAAYLRTGFVLAQPTNALLQISFSGAFRVWLNGQPVAEENKYNTYEDFMRRVPLAFHAGTNVVVVKLCTENNNYTFSALLTTVDNAPLFLKNIQPEDKTIPLKCVGAKVWQKPLLTPGAEAWREICKTNDSIYAKLMLGKFYYAIKKYDEAIKTFEQLMKSENITPASLFLLGDSYISKDCDSQAIAAFHRAVELDPAAAEIQTRIAEHYFDRGLNDLAQPILEEILAKNSNCFSARIKLIDLFDKRDWDEDAYRLAKETAKLFPTSPVAQKRVYYALSDRNCDELCETALKKALAFDYDNYYSRYYLARLYFSERKMDEFFKQIEILEKLFPTVPEIYKLKINAYISLRDVTNALNVCNHALGIFPDHYGLYSSLGDIYYMNKQRAKAIDSYHLSLKYSPDYLWLRRYLDFLEGRDQAFFDKYSYSDQQIKELVKKYKDITPASQEEISRVLLEQVLVQIFNDGSSRYLFHYVRKVLHPKGVKDYSSVSLPGGSASRLLKAVTYKKDGKIIEATHLDSGQIEFPDVQVGDTIEYKSMYDRYGGSWMDEHFYSTFSFDYNQSKVVREEVAIALGTNRPARVFYNPPSMIYTTEVFKANIVRQWVLTNIPMYHSEPLSPPYLDVARKVSFSTITNWSLIADWERGMISEIANANGNLKSLTEKITRGATSDVQKIEMIFNYITKNFRYTQMYENNIAKVKPHPIPDILANRCGDCKDLALLMIQMLKTVGVPAHTALLRSAKKGQIIESVPAPDVFNHVIVYVPGIGGKGIFVDPTYRLGEFNLLHSECQNVLALVIKPDGYELIRTPLLPPSASKTIDTINGQIFQDGTLTGSLVNFVYNNDAAKVRNFLERVTKLQDIGSYVAGQIDSSARMLSFDIKNREAHTGLPLKMTLDFAAPQFGRKNNDAITFSLPFPFKSINYLQGLEKRTLPLKFENLGGNYYEYIFKIPEGYSVIIPEKNSNIKNKFGEFNFKAQVNDRTLKIKWKFIITKQLISTEEYPELRNFLNKCSHITSQVITLKEDNGGFFGF